MCESCIFSRDFVKGGREREREEREEGGRERERESTWSACEWGLDCVVLLVHWCVLVVDVGWGYIYLWVWDGIYVGYTMYTCTHVATHICTR